MHEKKVRLSLLFVTIISIVLSPVQTMATNNTFQVPASAALAVDYETGKILYDHNSDEVLGIASMTKLLTAYIIYGEIEKGTISWDDTVPVSDKLKEMSQDPGLSNIPIYNDQVFTVKEALYGSLIASANSLTSALAEMVSGTETQFIDKMHEQLGVWGINDALLVSSSGLGNEDAQLDFYSGTSETDENMLSAKSMAIVARHLIQDFPEVLEITSLPSYNILENTDKEATIWSSNDMLEGLDYYKAGVDGLKTGTTPLAGNCFIGTINRDGRRIITVLMNVDEEANRFEQTANLMDYVFETWSYDVIAEKNDISSQKELTISNGKEKTVGIVLADNLSLWTTDSSDITFAFKPNNQVQINDEISAPQTKGTIVGEQISYDKNDTLGYLETTDKKEVSADVILKNDIEKENFFMQMWHSIFPIR